MILFLIYWW